MSRIAIIGAGPAGLFAAETLAAAGFPATLYDQMPSPARKFLLAGRSGLNLTHSEPLERFVARYLPRAPLLEAAIRAFPPEALTRWCEGLGQPVFTGSSGRVFPVSMKAAPLLRAWLQRLDGLAVRFAPRHRWLGFGANGANRFSTTSGACSIAADATILACGGASWPRLGSDGAWLPVLRDGGVGASALRASNCGVLIDWSPVFASRFEGVPLKRIAIAVDGGSIRGEAVITREGLEGGAIYAHSGAIRRALDASGETALLIDLKPDMRQEDLALRLDRDRGGRSLANFLRQQAALPPVAIGLVQEVVRGASAVPPLSVLVKSLPLRVRGVQPIGRAISSAGGVGWEELDSHFMLRRLPGVFVAGEMLDWDAPTGGYLLQACFSTGLAAANGVAAWLTDQPLAATASQ